MPINLILFLNNVFIFYFMYYTIIHKFNNDDNHYDDYNDYNDNNAHNDCDDHNNDDDRIYDYNIMVYSNYNHHTESYNIVVRNNLYIYYYLKLYLFVLYYNSL